jgi:hypothetical protein
MSAQTSNTSLYQDSYSNSPKFSSTHLESVPNTFRSPRRFSSEHHHTSSPASSSFLMRHLSARESMETKPSGNEEEDDVVIQETRRMEQWLANM